jgi:sialidase-1
MSKELAATHSIVCRLPGDRLGYFGWPTVARLADETLVVASSGLRSEHVCPWGKTVLNFSTDEGRTWSLPRVINDSPIDDRDAGIISTGGRNLLVSWFTSIVQLRADPERTRRQIGDTEFALWQETLATWTDELIDQNIGSWVKLSGDNGMSWGPPIRVPVTAPHGPIRLRSGALLYLGKRFLTRQDTGTSHIGAVGSQDGGRTWQELGTVPEHPQSEAANYHEPHVVELPSGRLIGMIRIQNYENANLGKSGITTFSMMQTESDDGGRTWTEARPLGFHGSPPHLMQHSSGALILTYGYRLAPFGQRVAFSYDEGKTWNHDWILRADGPDDDLGYPSTVELGDGSLYSVYYQKVAGDHRCSLLASRWQLPRARDTHGAAVASDDRARTIE